MSIVYFDPRLPAASQPVFRRGDASRVVADEEGGLTADERGVEIPPNSAHALLGHGVVAALNRLEPEFADVGSGRDALFHPAVAPELAAIFYDADRRTYGPRWSSVEFVVKRDADVEYRIAIDNREYQRTLSRLQYLATTAGRHGQGVRIRL
ncbi:MAG: hypothetical protein QNK05_21400 [Myxococcota bacterium]|nr:hypothetical protein [Myxococcota bacterium]